ncbi:hypothetical protein JX265_010021 [Neoarthrinium moseri]|uniref:FAD-binding domain-containing protein n=1 Tax=Neoarthrinium moseri TaxID=1658444 RepID=A0A9Q0ALY0_9PEZI|nr:hypothetical protein JX266_009371 [Neoarthrinium moseri]KAI1860097.1 hypothetical protein JX265_010021 [Neoarthrinium moseri]
MASTKQPHIAIVGGGPAGLTLGLLLKKRSIPFTIYELRPKPTEDDYALPSGSLDLHPDTGLAAISACGLLDEFNTLTGECSQSNTITDKDGTILLNDDGGDNTRPEISRHLLTKLLLSRLPTDCIQWQHKLLSAYEGEEGGRYVLDFGPHHGMVTADLVIGADGAWSRVRPLLTHRKPHYSGVHFVTLTIPNLGHRFPELADLVGAGSFIAPGDRNILMSQRGALGAARIYLSIHTLDENFGTTTSLEHMSQSEARDLLLSSTARHNDGKYFGAFGPKFQKLITQGFRDNEGPIDVKPLYMLPVGQLSWQHRPGVTVIGDAAHLMTPFAGEGVNLAMKDALELADAINAAWIEASDSETGKRKFRIALEERLEEFETQMINRAEETAEETWNNLQIFHDEDARTKIPALFQGYIGEKPLE